MSSILALNSSSDFSRTAFQPLCDGVSPRDIRQDLVRRIQSLWEQVPLPLNGYALRDLTTLSPEDSVGDLQKKAASLSLLIPDSFRKKREKGAPLLSPSGQRVFLEKRLERACVTRELPLNGYYFRDLLTKDSEDSLAVLRQKVETVERFPCFISP